MENLDTTPLSPSCPTTALIVGPQVASLRSGETDRVHCGQSCLNSGTSNQSSLSVSVSPSVFLIAHSPPPHSDGVWSRAENGQSGSSRTHYYHCSSYLPLSLSLRSIDYSHITLLARSLSRNYNV